MSNKLKQLAPTFSFAQNEIEILKFWKILDLYSKKIVEKNKSYPIYNFQDGPPFVSSANLHFGHIHISIMKSFLVNYLNMKGYNVLNKSGKDCHGLPIETIVSGNLGLKTNEEIKNYGLLNYNNECHKTINEYAESWNPIFDRIGRFLDYKNEYYTMDLNYMESTWWAWKSLYNKGLIYQGYKIMPYSTACGTSLSVSEASGDDVFKEVTDMSIYVKFELKEQKNTYLVVWTTTPWTLPSNLSLAINTNIEYVKVLDNNTKEYYILAKNCLKNLYKVNNKKIQQQYEIIETFLGEVLENKIYIPLFEYFSLDREFKIITANFVKEESGTGIVHLAPAFGNDDFDACILKNIVTVENVGDFCPIDDNGFFTNNVSNFKGMHVFETNKPIIEILEKSNKLIKKEPYKHQYPFCWRTDTPLIYKVVSSYFIKVTDVKDKMVELNEKVNWIPNTIGSGRFKQWLQGAKDWGVSRSRFFGTPIPMWISDDGKETICVGSIDELVELANLTVRPTNLHPEYINDILIPSKEGRGMLKRNLGIMDCWFESGCAPFAQLHYPFENTNFFDNREFLTDFICEGLDQTRGWFYTLMVLSTSLFNKPAFKNAICSGLILAEDGKKFSKRLGNFVSPINICNEFGADALRLYLSGSPAAYGEPFQFVEKSIKEINAKLFQLFNSYKFLIENIIKYDTDGNNLDINVKSDNIMDVWIITRLSSVIINIENCMEKYEFYKVKREILDFIEDLTNWYIKINRNRIKGKNCNIEDQQNSIVTLYNVILTFSKTIAPFMPFLAETMYQELSKLLPTNQQNESVHLCEYPDMSIIEYDPNVTRQMKILQDVCRMVRSLRDKTKHATSIKVPLKSVTVINETNEVLNDLQLLENYLKEEINTLNVIYENDHGQIVYSLEPKNKELGLAFKTEAKLIKSKLSSLTQEDIMKYIDTNKIVLNINNKEVILDDQYFVLVKERNLLLGSNEITTTNNKTTIIINHEYNDEIIKLHTKRLIIVGIQQIRKKTNLKPWDKVKFFYKSNQFIEGIFEEYNEEIKLELNYPAKHMENFHGYIIVKSNFEINGEIIDIVIVDDK